MVNIISQSSKPSHVYLLLSKQKIICSSHCSLNIHLRVGGIIWNHPPKFYAQIQMSFRPLLSISSPLKEVFLGMPQRAVNTSVKFLSIFLNIHIAPRTLHSILHDFPTCNVIFHLAIHPSRPSANGIPSIGIFPGLKKIRYFFFLVIPNLCCNHRP